MRQEEGIRKVKEIISAENRGKEVGNERKKEKGRGITGKISRDGGERKEKKERREQK